MPKRKIRPKPSSKDDKLPKSPWEIQHYYEDEFDLLHDCYKSGNLAALLDALVICVNRDISLPEWVGEAMLRIMVRTTRGESIRSMGRHARWESKFAQNAIDLKRYSVFSEFHESGMPVEKAREITVEALQEGESWATGSEDAIKKSCQRYKKNVKKNPSRYYWPDSFNFVFLFDPSVFPIRNLYRKSNGKYFWPMKRGGSNLEVDAKGRK